jgi:hypothetical protein
MSWEKPSFREVNMNSEIGAYHEDFDDDRKPDNIGPKTLSADQAIIPPDQTGTRT